MVFGSVARVAVNGNKKHCDSKAAYKPGNLAINTGMGIYPGVGPGKTHVSVARRLKPTHSASTFGVSTTYQNSGPTTDTASPRVIMAVIHSCNKGEKSVVHVKKPVVQVKKRLCAR